MSTKNIARCIGLATAVAFGIPSMALAGHYGYAHESHNQFIAEPPAAHWGGRQVEAPPWSFACMTDHGPSNCREPMWVYGHVPADR